MDYFNILKWTPRDTYIVLVKCIIFAIFIIFSYLFQSNYSFERNKNHGINYMYKVFYQLFQG